MCSHNEAALAIYHLQAAAACRLHHHTCCCRHRGATAAALGEEIGGAAERVGQGRVACCGDVPVALTFKTCCTVLLHGTA